MRVRGGPLLQSSQHARAKTPHRESESFHMRTIRRLLVVLACSFLISPTFRADEPVATDVTFKGHGDLELHGTLLLPAGADADHRVPAVLLLPGSGPTDRDGNQRPMLVTDVLKQIAERLAQEGVATLRFDKRAVMRYAPHWPRDLASIADYFAWAPFVGDATAAFTFLRDHQATDAAHVAILGHSEGGLLALNIAHDLADAANPPAGLILCGTAGRTLDIVLREQIERQVDRSGISDEARAKYLGALEEAIAEVRDKGELTASVPPTLRTLFNPSTVKLLHAYFTVDPLVLCARVRGPVIVLNGEHDAQVSAERDAPRLREALEKREGGWPVELVIAPGTSHNLKPAETMDSPGFTGPVTDEVMEAIVKWARDHLVKDR